jgi:prolyl-tRNA synthetase
VTIRCIQRADGSLPASEDEADLVAIVGRSY